jgi:UrcA family protein
MFTALFLSLAITSAADKPITIIDDMPRVVIPLAPYDLGNPRDVDRLNHRIVTAAKMVCEQGYRGVSYLETVACVKTAVADGKGQLGQLLAQTPASTALSGAIAIAAPRK